MNNDRPLSLSFIIFYVLLLVIVYNWTFRAKLKELLIIFIIIAMMLTILKFKYLDLIISIAFGITLLGLKYHRGHEDEFIFIMIIGFGVISMGDIPAIIVGLIVLLPSLIEAFENWPWSEYCWYEITLTFIFSAMIVTYNMKSTNQSDLLFLCLSFIFKVAIIFTLLT